MHKTRIIIVEDEMIIAMDIKRRAVSLGYDVIAHFQTAEECISKLPGLNPDLILMDIILSGDIDGIEAAGIIKERFNIPLIYLTAHADETTIQRAKVTQPYGYILKPFEIRDLETTIEIALYKHSMESKLAESELKYRTLVHTATDAVLILDYNGDIISFNPSVSLMFGYSEQEITGASIKKLLPDVFINHTVEGVKRFLSVGKSISSNIIELTARKKNNRSFPVELSFSEWSSNNNSFSTLIIRDITKRKKIEEELKRAHDEMEERVEERTIELKALIDQSPLPITIYDLNGDVVYANAAWERLWNISLEDFRKTGSNIFNNGVLSQFGYLGEMKKIFSSGGSFRTKPLYFDPVEFGIFEDSDGKLLIFNFYALINERGKVFRVVSFEEDITERVKAEEINLELKSRRKSSEAMIDKLEEERFRISRDLHDSVGQMLSAIKFNIEVYEKSNKIDSPQLKESKKLITATGQELKNIIHSLRPLSIDNYGLAPSLELLVSEIKKAGSLNLYYETNGQIDRLDQKSELNIYRIIQEALNNIVKHSHAEKAELILASREKLLTIIVRDNGRGFNINDLAAYSQDNPSFGLINMKERVGMLSGNIQIVSAPEKGTEITIEIPVV
ncbi:MAG: PAS domain S-box protein [Syntrophothermus sp.]